MKNERQKRVDYLMDLKLSYESQPSSAQSSNGAYASAIIELSRLDATEKLNSIRRLGSDSTVKYASAISKAMEEYKLERSAEREFGPMTGRAVFG